MAKYSKYRAKRRFVRYTPKQKADYYYKKALHMEGDKADVYFEKYRHWYWIARGV